MYHGSAIIDFGSGSTRAYDVKLVVMLDAALTRANRVRVYMAADNTEDNDEDSHVMAASLVRLVTDGCIDDQQFTIWATSAGEVTGKFKARWNWD